MFLIKGFWKTATLKMRFKSVCCCHLLVNQTQLVPLPCSSAPPPQPPCSSFWSLDILGRNEPSSWHWELSPSRGCIWNNWGLENMAEDWCIIQLRHLFFHQIVTEHQLGNKHHATGWDDWLVFRLMRNKQLACSLGSAMRWKTGAIRTQEEAIKPSVGRGWAVTGA